jgi:hypothetical protein
MIVDHMQWLDSRLVVNNPLNLSKCSQASVLRIGSDLSPSLLNRYVGFICFGVASQKGAEG